MLIEMFRSLLKVTVSKIYDLHFRYIEAHFIEISCKVIYSETKCQNETFNRKQF